MYRIQVIHDKAQESTLINGEDGGQTNLGILYFSRTVRNSVSPKTIRGSLATVLEDSASCCFEVGSLLSLGWAGSVGLPVFCFGGMMSQRGVGWL
jgi:hypothetical protein